MSSATHSVVEVTTSMYWTATAVFLLVYALIISEKVEKTKAALFGGAAMLGLSILTQEEAFYSERLGVDYNVIFLLIGMMLMINIMGKSGVFQWMAIRVAKAAKGLPGRILLLFVLICAISSAFLDNVTTVMLLGPVTLLICDELDLDPTPFLLSEALASNIGGTATLIGDPPNIMVASKAQLTFVDFLVHLAPAVLVMLVALLGIVWLLFGRSLKVSEEKRKHILNMDPNALITDRKLLIQSVAVVGTTIAGFALHGVLHIEPASLALMGAAVLLLIADVDVHKTLAEVEWPAIFFFIGLFLTVGGVVKVGLVEDLSSMVIAVTGPTATDMTVTTLVVLWFSGIASAIVDNIPFVATMIPLVTDMANTIFHAGQADPGQLPTETLHHPVLMPVWWALALGACLGGNGSPIGASANVIIMGLAEKSGNKISFLRFVALGAPVTILTLAIGTVYVYLRYL